LFSHDHIKDTDIYPEQNTLRKEYDALFTARVREVRALEARIEDTLAVFPSSPRVKGRVKSFESYFKKFIRLLKHNVSPNPGITDLIGVRVVCPFMEDLSAVEKILKEKYKVIEAERKGNHTFREFGYESIHLLISVPEDISANEGIPPGETAEIQIRTILQDAWAEVEHELVYKAEFTPFDAPLKRKLAAVNASLSLADIIFQEVRSYQRELNGELGKRRDSFFRKIENSTDAILFPEEKPPAEKPPLLESKEPPRFTAPANASIDDLLLGALTAHNMNQFDEAIAIYSRILKLNPDAAVSSLIYKHRGMAHFACSHYEEAIADFSASLRMDPKSYKAAYYEGIVCSVLRRYPEAVNAFSDSLEVNPYQPYCLFRRGQAYYHLEDFPQALGDCEAALAMETFEAALKFKALVLTRLKM
jgi:putative GTP pyrophosphokinase